MSAAPSQPARVTCPHCGDVTAQDMLLPEFTCGECDQPFHTQTTASLSDARRRSWETRRAKYGQKGHSGAYARPPSILGRKALQLVARLHEEGMLSEGQCCKALAMERVEFRIMCNEFAGEIVL